jgi:hypothetical protein
MTNFEPQDIVSAESVLTTKMKVTLLFPEFNFSFNYTVINPMKCLKTSIKLTRNGDRMAQLYDYTSRISNGVLNVKPTNASQ